MRQFDPSLPHYACFNFSAQDAQPQLAPDGYADVMCYRESVNGKNCTVKQYKYHLESDLGADPIKKNIYIYFYYKS